MQHCSQWVINNITYHLPDLHDVVFWHGTNHPRFILVPRKVGDLGRVTAVNELHIHTTLLPLASYITWLHIVKTLFRILNSVAAKINHINCIWIKMSVCPQVKSSSPVRDNFNKFSVSLFHFALNNDCHESLHIRKHYALLSYMQRLMLNSATMVVIMV